MEKTENKEEQKVKILFASQFINAVKRDFNVEIDPQSVCLGRLAFRDPQENRDSGYVCFFSLFDTDGTKKAYYLKAWNGETERRVKCGIWAEKPSDCGDVCLIPRQQYFPGSSTFRAKGNIDWCYVPIMREDGLDYKIEEASVVERAKLQKVREQEQARKQLAETKV